MCVLCLDRILRRAGLWARGRVPTLLWAHLSWVGRALMTLGPSCGSQPAPASPWKAGRTEEHSLQEDLLRWPEARQLSQDGQTQVHGERRQGRRSLVPTRPQGG